MSESSILTAGLLTVSSTTMYSMLPEDVGGLGKLPDVRTLIGTSFAFTILSALDGPAPQLATPLAWCIAFTALTYYGIPLADNWFNNKHHKVGLPKNAR